MCLTSLMKALIGETDKISLVCYFERCCINTERQVLLQWAFTANGPEGQKEEIETEMER